MFIDSVEIGWNDKCEEKPAILVTKGVRQRYVDQIVRMCETSVKGSLTSMGKSCVKQKKREGRRQTNFGLFRRIRIS